MTDLLQFFKEFTRILSWVAFPFAMWAIATLIVEVIPAQFREYKIKDDIVDVRKRLPVLTIAFTILAVIVSVSLAYNMLTGRNGYDIYSNLLRFCIGFMIFIKGYTWKMLYYRNNK